MLLHPDDVLFFNEVRTAMFRVAKKYELPLVSVEPYKMPSKAMADLLGCCSASGHIQIVMRATVDGQFCDEPRTPDKVWDTAAHELAHLRHFNHGDAFVHFAIELREALNNQQEDHKEKVLKRLVKMQAQRDGEAAIGNAAAAEAFAEAINRMLIEHELNPTDIDYARATDRDPVVEISVDMARYNIERKKVRVAWQESLARVVANAHLCTFLIIPGSNRIVFVGTKSHATVAEYVFGTLVPIVNKMAHKEYCDYWWKLKNTTGNTKEAGGFKSSWIDAFIRRVTERFEEARKAAIAEADARQTDKPAGAESVAMIRLNGALVKVRKYIDDKFKSRRSGTAVALKFRNARNAEGKARGRAAADRIAIGRKGVTGGNGPRGLLS